MTQYYFRAKAIFSPVGVTSRMLTNISVIMCVNVIPLGEMCSRTDHITVLGK